jgi:hypothetical protein
LCRTEQTAHAQVLAAMGWDSDDCVGGAITKGGPTGWGLKANSGTINREGGGRGGVGGNPNRAHMNALGIAKQMLEDGEYWTVSAAGSVNKGVKHFAFD